jgi:hypothetical protein
MISSSSFCFIQMMGGLGNQMFEIATCYAHARRTGRTPIFSGRTNCKRSTYWTSFLHRCSGFVAEQQAALTGGCHWHEPHFRYHTIPADVTSLGGYFQSSRYFADCSGDIRTLFDPHPDIKAAVAERYAELLTADGRDAGCVVHVRRTDYLSAAAFHVVCDKAWYARALAEMDRQRAGQATRYLIFSDDLAWCRAPEQADLWGERDVVFIDEADDCRALHLMSQFRAFVIANSSFSWWATWLLPTNKTVIAPNRWFGPSGPQDWEDIYEPGWIRLP